MDKSLQFTVRLAGLDPSEGEMHPMAACVEQAEN